MPEYPDMFGGLLGSPIANGKNNHVDPDTDIDGNKLAVQCKGRNAPHVAQQGASVQLKGGDSPRRVRFPHAATIEHSTGQSIRGSAVVDPAACSRRDVEAFTDGDKAHFASAAPSLHVAAHEATHLLQHAGRTNDAQLGAEGHAHAVAEAVVHGQPSQHLIGERGASVPGNLHNYRYVQANEQRVTGTYATGHTMMASEDGRAAVASDESKAREFYADPQLVTQANGILLAKKSKIALQPHSETIKGTTSDGKTEKTLVKVWPFISATDRIAVGPGQEWWADCGRAAREVMGPGDKRKPYAVYTDASGKRQQTAASKRSNPKDFIKEILAKEFPKLAPDERHAAYAKLSQKRRDDIDKRYGLNLHAAPGIGEAYTSQPDPDSEGKASAAFHWGGVVLIAGKERVTLENFIGNDQTYETRDQGWRFGMYGSASNPQQTFHHTFKPHLGGSDAKPITMSAATSAPDGATSSSSQQQKQQDQ